MRYSEFNIAVRLPSGSVIVRNLRTKRVAELLPQYIDGVTDFGGGATVPESLQEFLPKMTDMGLIVPDNFDEGGDFLSHVHHRRHDLSKLDVEIAPTMTCQMTCSYCFENGHRTDRPMKDEIIQAFLQKLRLHFELHAECKHLTLVLFGGEPLLGWRVIEKLLPRVAEICAQFGVELGVDLTTNAELLDLQKTEFLAQFPWKVCQITFEGPREIHDAIRVPVNGKPTFDAIYGNMMALLGSSFCPERVSARVNFDRANLARVPDLFQMFVADGLASHHAFDVSPGELQRTPIPGSLQANIGLLEGMELAQAYLYLFGQMKALGLQEIPEVMWDAGMCREKRDGAWIVSPDGLVGGCDSMIGRADGAHSSVLQQLPMLRVQPNSSFKYLEDCRAEQCPNRPVCLGGCTFNHFQVKGEWNRHCRKEYLLAVNRGLLELHYGDS